MAINALQTIVSQLPVNQVRISREIPQEANGVAAFDEIVMKLLWQTLAGTENAEGQEGSMLGSWSEVFSSEVVDYLKNAQGLSFGEMLVKSEKYSNHTGVNL